MSHPDTLDQDSSLISKTERIEKNRHIQRQKEETKNEDFKHGKTGYTILSISGIILKGGLGPKCTLPS